MHTKQLILLPYKTKPRKSGVIFFGRDRVHLPVKFLTEFSCRPGSRFLPFGQRNYTPSNKNIAAPFESSRHKAVYAAPYTKIKTAPKGTV